MKRFDEYYDQHQVRAVDILEQLALSLKGSNRIQEAEKIIEKLSRMDSNSHVVKFFKENDRNAGTASKKPEMKMDVKAVHQKLCHTGHVLSSNMFTCPI